MCAFGISKHSSDGFKYLPELRLSPSDPVHQDVRCVPQRQRYRSPILIPLILVLVIPLLPISVEECLPVASDSNIRPTNSPGRRTSCVGDGNTMRQPILDIRTPNESAVNIDVAVLQVQNIHHLADLVVAFHELDGAILSALLECVEDLRCIVHLPCSPKCCHYTIGASNVDCSQYWHSKQ